MLTKEQNELLTVTTPGNPGGNFLRRYWQPVALSEEVSTGSAPLPVKILSEELVLFRDDQGRAGLLGLHCCHRGADLSYGRIEDGGLRCLYHGWLFDINGCCLEQPAEPEVSEFHKKVKQRSYPCHEIGGLIFAYMGGGEQPEFPNYEFLHAPDEHRYILKVFHECNYLQGNEGNIDPGHLSYLHRLFKEDEPGYAGNRYVRGSNATANELQTKDKAPRLETEITDFGVRVYTIRKVNEEKNYLKVSNFVYPNLSAVPGAVLGDGYLVNWHVPVDDHHHYKYMITYKRSAPLDKEYMKRQDAKEIGPDFKQFRNRENRFLQDREEMKTKTFIGLGTNFHVHDSWAWDGQGYVQDRTDEHLGYSDKAIAQSRQLLLKAVKEVDEHKEAPHVVRNSKDNFFPQLIVLSEVVPASVDCKEYVRQKIEELRQKGSYIREES